MYCTWTIHLTRRLTRRLNQALSITLSSMTGIMRWHPGQWTDQATIRFSSLKIVCCHGSGYLPDNDNHEQYRWCSQISCTSELESIWMNSVQKLLYITERFIAQRTKNLMQYVLCMFCSFSKRGNFKPIQGTFHKGIRRRHYCHYTFLLHQSTYRRWAQSLYWAARPLSCKEMHQTNSCCNGPA